MSDLVLGFSIRVGTVTKIGKTRLYFALSEKLDGQEFEVSIPYPYAGRGSGVFGGFEIGSLILVMKGPEEKWYCVGSVPNRNFYFDLDGVLDAREYETPYPDIAPGEVILKSSVGSRVDLLDDGNIRLDAGMGLSLADIELSRDTESLFIRVPNEYKFTEAGRKIEGVIRRDMNEVEFTADTNTLNFLEGERYHRLLSDIGRSPSDEVQNRTTKLIKQTSRNPALIEKRELIYEYADSFDVRHLEDERSKTLNNVSEALKIQTPISSRQRRRTDILNLNSFNFNNLIEKVEGTLVDIYGNILDINRNIIANIPSSSDIAKTGNDKSDLKKIYDYHRRGIKLHYEINSRKDIRDSEPSDSDKNKNNAKLFSRWSVDVDGEGLTKVNIPASSETGNIPVLGRYFTKRDENNKDRMVRVNEVDPGRDISILQFGVDGQTIKNSDYASGGVSNTGTAFHNITNVASSIINKGTLGDSGRIISRSVSNKIGDKGGPADGANAGGRSLHMNLDGSLELSVGADTVDRKSMVIDTQGGVISHFGKDNNGRSIIHQSDGDVLIQIGGGKTDSKDDRFIDIPQSGRLEIHIARSGGGSPQKILIDDQGMVLDIQGNMIFKSSGDIGLDAGARLVLHGEMVFIYGKVDVESRQVVAQETLIIRAGMPQFT